MINKVGFKNLSHAFGEEKILFDGLTADLPTNEIVFFDGGIGSGRSSLLKMMAGLLTPQKGSVTINNRELSELSFEEFLPTRTKIGYSFEYNGLLNNRTLRENLLLPVQYHSLLSAAAAERHVSDLLEVFGINTVADKRPSAVSGSQRKSCVVARAFSMEPELVLLDEPFAGLSSAAIENFKKFVLEKRKAGSLQHVFFTCQNPRDIEGWATKKIYVESNRVVESILEVALKGAA